MKKTKSFGNIRVVNHSVASFSDELPLQSADEGHPEDFVLASNGIDITRIVRKRDGSRRRTTFTSPQRVKRSDAYRSQLASMFDLAYLKSKKRPPTPSTDKCVRLVDLFSGSGFMSLGVLEAARACGFRAVPVLAVDCDSEAIETYKLNFAPCRAETSDVRDLFPGKVNARLQTSEIALKRMLGGVDLLIGGPPCQGHSNFNNFTRRMDPKNALYERMARAAAVLEPEALIIENVASVLNDSGRVVDVTASLLERLGYTVVQGVMDLSKFGVAQTRKRHVLVASLNRNFSMTELMNKYETPPRSVGWAIGDLSTISRAGIYDTASVPTPIAKRRIEYLFCHGLYDLPDSRRPVCHKEQLHRYKSVYGRLDWKLPAQTITSGFNCMGQGRFVHPRQRRTITPHEAARLQFIPDFFKFPSNLNRGALSTMIGNAVPPKLSYVITCELFR